MGYAIAAIPIWFQEFSKSFEELKNDVKSLKTDVKSLKTDVEAIKNTPTMKKELNK